MRCARCGEVWLAMPQEIAAHANASWRETAETAPRTGFTPERVSGNWPDGEAPHVESPSISSGWDDPVADGAADADQHWPSLARQDDISASAPSAKKRARWLPGPGWLRSPSLKPSNWTAALPAAFNLPTACMALSAVVFVLIAWRTDVVRMMPQTAAFFRMTGLGVNLRGLQFEDLKISTEIVNNKPVLLIEGAIIDVARKSVEIPRLRFIVRDANGSDIYAWNAVLEQPVINPGEKAWFKTRLASPPAEGREIAVRFFHKLDIAAGGA